jgi:hypothetical protein
MAERTTRSERGGQGRGDGNGDFRAFLKSAPTLEDASSQESTIISGLVFQAEGERFAITTADGQTYELEVGAVERFKVMESQGFTPIVTLQLSREALSRATLRPIKPIIKDLHKDIIKEVVHDENKLPWKDIIKDPIRDTYKEVPKDPIQDTYKEVSKDPIRDTYKEVRKDLTKDIRKDPIFDPAGTLVWDQIDPGGTGIADTAAENIGQWDPSQGVVNPAAGMAGAGFGQGDMTPFIMATQHQAPDYMVGQQMGAQPGMQAAFGGGGQFKPFAQDTIKEIQYETVYAFDRQKHFPADTRKEIIFDTRKEMIWDTWIEQGPYTLQETTFDPGTVTQPPVWGFPGVMM